MGRSLSFFFLPLLLLPLAAIATTATDSPLSLGHPSIPPSPVASISIAGDLPTPES
jgi:hypothetical protein